MAYVLGTSTEDSASVFLHYLKNNAYKGHGNNIAVHAHKRRGGAYINTSDDASITSGIIIGTLESLDSVRVIYDTAGEYDPGEVISVSVLSAVYGSHQTVGVNVVVFRAQIGVIGGRDI